MPTENKTPIYLDYAATTPVSEKAMAAAAPYFSQVFYNPASTHALGQSASNAVERARAKCASAIGASSGEIYFTSGGTESINTAFKCLENTKRKQIIVSAIEHDSVAACAELAKKRGYTIDYAYPNRYGTIEPKTIEKLITDDTALVCVMTVNNITGAIQPVKELSAIAHDHGALFFTDAVQAVNTVDIDVKDWGADMLAVSAHKFYGMKGAGFLYVKRGAVDVSPLIVGGEQEYGKRAGTHNVPALAAMGEAIEQAVCLRSEYNAHAQKISQAFINGLKYGKPVDIEHKTPDIVSVVFDGINGGRLAVALSMSGVCCSVGSACSAGSAMPPQTLIAMGVEKADSSVRFSFGRTTTEREVLTAARIVSATVEKLSN